LNHVSFKPITFVGTRVPKIAHKPATCYCMFFSTN